MLELLRIKNMALIEDLEMELSPGLNVLSGESGAGKSFILRALDFILGAKISAEMVRPGRDKAAVEAVFVQNGEELLLKRELSAETGRSRCYMNDSLSSQARLAELKDKLLIHTSQHGQQKLLKPAYHSRILDMFWDGSGLFRKKADRLSRLRELDEEESRLKRELEEVAEKKDFLLYQKEEIDKVAPQAGEEEELQQRQKEIRSRADLEENVTSALDIIHSGGLLDNIFALHKKVEEMARTDEEFKPFADRMQETAEYVRELESRLRSVPIQDGMQEQEAVESRLWELSSLKRRLNRDMDQILALGEEINENLSFLDQGELRLKQLSRDKEGLKEELAGLVKKISSGREQACRPLKEALESSLRQLGFPKEVSLHFEFIPEEIYPGIQEHRPRIMWVPNPGQSPQPLDRIASGGELSRFLLALVGLRSKQDLPTLLFDEVDAGIGGETLNKVGRHIRMLSASRQVILITHWPQLARLADRHFLVSKKILDQETTTHCRRLDAEESRAELARMAGGGNALRAIAGDLAAR
ncbi:MAG: DNA repair protein RecN [Desulfonatronovibrionaceae bacterium]